MVPVTDHHGESMLEPFPQQLFCPSKEILVLLKVKVTGSQPPFMKLQIIDVPGHNL